MHDSYFVNLYKRQCACKTRYAGGYTSGHSNMGLSNLQRPSLVATISFIAGGFIMANLILPYILSL